MDTIGAARELHVAIEALEKKYDCVITHATWGFEITEDGQEIRNKDSRYVNLEFKSN